MGRLLPRYRGTVMRSLCVAEAYPWPCDDGYRLRLANTIEALCSLGAVDFLCLDGSGRHRDAPPLGVRVLSAPEGEQLPTLRWAARWMTSRAPRRLVRRNFAAARHLAPGLLDGPYDLTLVSHVDAWHAVGHLVEAPVVLDFDNLEDLALRGIRLLGPATSSGTGLVERARGWVRWQAKSIVDRIDERRWRFVQHRAAAAVARVLVCSELDVERSGCSNVSVMPNGYELSWEPAQHRDVRDAAAVVFLFVGVLGYPPNVDAARWFATEVMPLIRAALPGACCRIVGRSADSVADLDSLEGVRVVGAVDSLRDELAGADVSVVPIRSGAGTRLKIIEAMANRLPIVSSAVGCEGLDVIDGEHLLVADGAAAFAAACVEVAGDVSLRERLITAGWERYEQRYTWPAIRAEVAALLGTISRRSSAADRESLRSSSG